MNAATIRALRAGAAPALRDVLRIDGPDLAWHVADPLERAGDSAGPPVVAGEVGRLEAASQNLDPIRAEPAATADEDGAERAA